MSYILDALKKSEQERGHGNVPGVQTIHSASISYRNDRPSWWPYLLIAAVFLNIAVIVMLNLDKLGVSTSDTGTTAGQSPPAINSPQPQKQTAVTTTPTKEGDTDNVPASPDTKLQQPASSGGQFRSPDNLQKNPAGAVEQHHEEASTLPVQESTPVTKSATAPQPVYNKAREVIDYNELPQQVRSQLPAIIISAHVYSTNPSQRSIDINNNFMEEGEYLIDGLVLHEITRNGAILDYQGTLFRYGAVSSWQ